MDEEERARLALLNRLVHVIDNWDGEIQAYVKNGRLAIFGPLDALEGFVVEVENFLGPEK